ncbi:MAG TPA: DUF3108 domain-containing protein [Polyangia bacterium]|nr:DUF3108 domain-containing protein [Polyangia bacterium]
MGVAWLFLQTLALSMTRPAHTCDEVGGAPRAVVAVPAALPAPRPIARPRPAPAAVAREERSRYRIEYGVLEIGELELAVAAALPGATSVHADGRGTGGVLGFGRMEDRIATDFDLVRLDSRRWDNARSGAEGDLRDRAVQADAGQVSLVRERLGAAAAPATRHATLATPLLDPLGFLLRVRIEPPPASPRNPPQILYVLDGQALWRVTVTNAGRASAPDGVEPVLTLRLDAEAEPVRWDGTPDTDGDRHHRSFKLWLSDDAARVPLRLEMPIGIANVVVALTDITRR